MSKAAQDRAAFQVEAHKEAVAQWGLHALPWQPGLVHMSDLFPIKLDPATLIKKLSAPIFSHTLPSHTHLEALFVPHVLEQYQPYQDVTGDQVPVHEYFTVDAVNVPERLDGHHIVSAGSHASQLSLVQLRLLPGQQPFPISTQQVHLLVGHEVLRRKPQ